MEFKDYYATLGVAKEATDKEIKQAYRKLARKSHPDVNPGDKTAESRFKEINEAYEVLGDPAKRRKYDELGANWRMYEQAERQGGASPFQGWSVNFGQGGGAGAGGGYRTMTEEEMRELFGDQDPFSDFFKTFFGGAEEVGRRSTRARRPTRARQGVDFESPVELTLEEAYAGTTRRLSVRHNSHTRSIEVRIPAGVKDGSRVRVAGEGGGGEAGGQAGDLYLQVRVLPHPKFTRDGADLHTRVAIPVTTAVLGGTVDVPALSGRTLRLKIPPLTQNGQRFRLRDQGMPELGKPSQRGSLYVTVEAQLPRALNDEQRRHYEALAKSEEVPAT